MTGVMDALKGSASVAPIPTVCCTSPSHTITVGLSNFLEGD